MKQSIADRKRGLTESAVLAAFAAVSAFLILWFAIPWQIGDMFAEYSRSAETGSVEIARLAVALAPENPRVNAFAGFAALADFDNFEPQAAAGYFETAARLAPFDYRYWSELGRAYEKAERFDDADRAFRRAISLAPEYSNPRWHYGNFLLRRGRAAEAIAELKKVAEYDSIYREQAFAIAWDYFGGDTDQVDQFAADRPDAFAILAKFYASLGRGGDALRIWNRISDTEKMRFNWIGKAIAQRLYEKQLYRSALEFVRQSGENQSARFGGITNGGFESRVAEERFPKFDWYLARSDAAVEVFLDNRLAHSGKRSARLTFRNYSSPTLDQLWQVVAIGAGGNYRLTFWARRENLRGGSLPLVAVATADGRQTIAASLPIQSGTGGWEKFEIIFKLDDKAEGVIVRIGREPCAVDCALVGTVWFDDFELEKL